MGDLKDHKRNKHPSEGDEPKPYCETCKKSLSSKSSLKMHANSKHQKQFIHNCDKYAHGTNNRQTMTSHKIRKDTSKEDSQQLEKFKCSICSKEFVTKQLLQKHLYSANCAVVEKIMNVLTVNHQNGSNQQNLWKNIGSNIILVKFLC